MDLLKARPKNSQCVWRTCKGEGYSLKKKSKWCAVKHLKVDYGDCNVATDLADLIKSRGSCISVQNLEIPEEKNTQHRTHQYRHFHRDFSWHYTSTTLIKGGIVMDEDRSYLGNVATCLNWLFPYFQKIGVVSMWHFTCPDNKRKYEMDQEGAVVTFVPTQLICLIKSARI